MKLARGRADSDCIVTYDTSLRTVIRRARKRRTAPSNVVGRLLWFRWTTVQSTNRACTSISPKRKRLYTHNLYINDIILTHGGRFRWMNKWNSSLNVDFMNANSYPFRIKCICFVLWILEILFASYAHQFRNKNEMHHLEYHKNGAISI